MQLLPISGISAVTVISSAVRNVCNATLSLLFTAALCIWGFLVNKKQAWRTDGGTAAFGCGAIFLAIVSTGLNFLYVPREEEYVWLPSLMWAVILWQSFLGWWWWVGAGSGAGLVGEDDVMRKVQREAKRETRKKEARQKRLETKQRAKNAGVTAPGHRGNLRPRVDSAPSANAESVVPSTRTLSDTTSDSSATTAASFLRNFPAVFQRWYDSLRHAHRIAARQQAAERVERIRERNRRETHVGSSGWGLGSFGWRLGTPPDSTRDFELRSTQRGDDRSGQKTETQTVIDGEEDFKLPAIRLGNPTRPQSIWWWGPLSRWRLKDSTVY